MKRINYYFLSKLILCILLLIQLPFISLLTYHISRNGIDMGATIFPLSLLMTVAVGLELRHSTAKVPMNKKLLLFSGLPAFLGGIILIQAGVVLMGYFRAGFIEDVDAGEKIYQQLQIAAALIALSWAIQGMNWTKLPRGLMAIYFLYGGMLVAVFEISYTLSLLGGLEVLDKTLVAASVRFLWGGFFAGLAFLVFQLGGQVKQRKAFA